MSQTGVRLPIETERLTIRPLRLDDAVALHELYGDREAMKHLASSVPQTVNESRQWVEEKINLHNETGLSLWAVVVSSTSEVVGDAGLQRLEDEETIEVGARIIRRLWGRGYGREAAQALIEAGFKDLGVDRIVGITAPGNTAAIHAMEKLGMRSSGTETHAGRDWVVYAATPPNG